VPVKYGNSAFESYIIRKNKNIRKEVRAEANQTARDLANWLTVAVRDWRHKPRFAGRVTVRPDYIEVGVDVAGTAKKIFFYVDQGTGKWGPKHQPYPIVPKNPGGMLKFQMGYSARTAPGAKIGQGTGQSFGDWVSKKEVMHPGIEGRKFTETVLKELTPDFEERISDAIDKGIEL
jgi:hypothetical protein